MSTKPIRVVVRMRPLQPHEAGHSTSSMQLVKERGTIVVGETGQEGHGKQRFMKNFVYDAVLGPSSDQEDVFSQAKVPDMVKAVLDGYNATTFVYGQTGSGKTYCMEGFKYKQMKISKSAGKIMEPRAVFEDTEPKWLGIIPRAIQLLFRSISRRTDRRFTVRVSYVQIYKEQVFDLLNVGALKKEGNAGQSVTGAGLKMRWSRGKQFYLENVFTCECKTDSEVIELYQSGINNKIMASHKMNAHSSRSHCLFTLQVDSAPVQAPEEMTSSKMTLVDLAGSERGSAAGSTSGKLQEESISINKSLFALRKVITALADGKSAASPHIPFRDSKLTCLLKDALGGSSLTTMIACISPSDDFLEENISTLEYSSRAKAITNQLVINEDPKIRIIRELRAQVAFLQEQLASSADFTESMPSMNIHPSAESDEPNSAAGGWAPLPKPAEVAAVGQMEQNAILGAAKGLAEMQVSSLYQTSTTTANTGPRTPSGKELAVSNITGQSSLKSKEEVVQQVENMGGYLLQCVSLLKQLGTTNTQLRNAYTKVYDQHQTARAENDMLMVENAELHDKVSLYEGVVSHQQQSPSATGITEGGVIHTASSAMLVELSDLRRENELLRAWCMQDARPLPDELLRNQAVRGRQHLVQQRSLRRGSPGKGAAEPASAKVGSPPRIPRMSSDAALRSSGLGHGASGSLNNKRPASHTMSVQQLQAVMNEAGANKAAGSVINVWGKSNSSPKSGSMHQGSSVISKGGSGLPAYFQPSKPQSAQQDANYQYSSISGSALRITTTGQLLPSASGMLSSPGESSNGTPTPAAKVAWDASNQELHSREIPESSSDGMDASSMDRLNRLFAKKSSLARARLQ